jgi:hypothetical protein
VIFVAENGEDSRPRLERVGARQENRHYLDEPAGVCYCFSEVSLQASVALLIAPADRRFGGGAKRKWGQVIGNKQFHETAHLAPPMSAMTCNRFTKPIVSLREESFRFCWFFRSLEAQNEMARNRRRPQGWCGKCRGRYKPIRAPAGRGKPRCVVEGLYALRGAERVS